MFSAFYRVNPLPQIPALGSWLRNGQNSEIGPSIVHYYYSWQGYALGVDVAVWVMTH